MTKFKTKVGRRSFIKNLSVAGGGMMIGFNWLASCNTSPDQIKELPKEWFEINGYLKIGDNGIVTIQSPNPEIGQNVKTSMPMLVAEELDINWDNVIVEQSPLDVSKYKWQVAGGSRSISSSWEPLRMAGATARQMLLTAAANEWQVPLDELTTNNGIITHSGSGKSAHYGQMASIAANLDVPKEVTLKDAKEYKIIGYEGKQVRDNIHSQDLVKCFWEFYKKPKYGEVYNIGGGRYSNCSVIEAINYIKEKKNLKIVINYIKKNRVGDHIWYISNCSKFKRHYPNWQQKYNTKKILDELIVNQ